MSSVQSFNSVAGRYVDYVKTITIGREYRATYEKLKGEDKTKISAEQRKEIKLYQKNKENMKVAKFTNEYFDNGNKLAEDRETLMMKPKIINYKF